MKNVIVGRLDHNLPNNSTICLVLPTGNKKRGIESNTSHEATDNDRKIEQIQFS